MNDWDNNDNLQKDEDYDYILNYRNEYFRDKLREIEDTITGRTTSFLPMITKDSSIYENLIEELIDELSYRLSDELCNKHAESKIRFEKFFRHFCYCAITGINPKTNERSKTFADIISIAESFCEITRHKNHKGVKCWKEAGCNFLAKNNDALSLAIGFYLPELCPGLENKGGEFCFFPENENILYKDDSGKYIDTVKSYMEYRYLLDCFNSTNPYAIPEEAKKDVYPNIPLSCSYGQMSTDGWQAVNPDKFIEYYELLQHDYFKADRNLLAENLKTLADNHEYELLSSYINDENGNHSDEKIEDFIDKLINRMKALNCESATVLQEEYARRFLYCAIEGTKSRVWHITPPETLLDIYEMAKEVADAPFENDKELMQHAYDYHGAAQYYKSIPDFFQAMNELYLAASGKYIFSICTNKLLAQLMLQYSCNAKKALINQVKFHNYVEKTGYDDYLSICKDLKEKPHFKTPEEYQEYLDYYKFSDYEFDDLYLSAATTEDSNNPSSKGRVFLIDNGFGGEDTEYMQHLLEYKQQVYEGKLEWLENLPSPFAFFENFVEVYAFCDEIDFSGFDKTIKKVVDDFLYDEYSMFTDVEIFSSCMCSLSEVQEKFERMKRKGNRK